LPEVLVITGERRQAVLNRLQAEGRLPSIVGAIVEDGRLSWVGTAGDAGSSTAQYRVGSITKTFTAVLVMQCRDDDLLQLDDQLGHYLPESGYGEATLRSLLGHSSGMQAEPVGPWWERSPGISVTDLVAANDGAGQVLQPGNAFHYSNLGFALLGEVVARLRGESWFNAVAERLLVPLGMERTTYNPEGEYAQGYSVGHFTGTLTREPHHDTGAMAPAGQLWSTVADLGLWLNFLVTGRPEVLAVETLTEMRNAAPFPDYGLGLRRLPCAQDTLIGHTGSMPGFMACAFIDPATGAGVITLSNATTGLSTDEAALELVAGAEAYKGERWSPSVTPPVRAEELLGLWFWGNTAHELRWSNQLLELRTLSPVGLEDKFVIEPDRIRGVEGYLLGETLHVERDDTGTVVALECATFRFTRTPYPDGP
jgi:CubicO group peptidase (beta-lactamase class C family)